jgi:hypothetical protein
LGIREQGEGKENITKEVEKVLILIDEALEKNEIEGWKVFYAK